jgi:hypothetical protein
MMPLGLIQSHRTMGHHLIPFLSDQYSFPNEVIQADKHRIMSHLGSARLFLPKRLRSAWVSLIAIISSLSPSLVLSSSGFQDEWSLFQSLECRGTSGARVI